MISFDHNIRDVMRDLSDMGRRQMPFALSLAINDTLADVERNSEKRMRRVIDNPTPFTLRGHGRRRASKRSLQGSVFVKDVQAAYLRFLEEGGTRGPKRRAIPIAQGQRLNRYGNMPKGAIKRLLASPKVFSGVPKGGGRPGIYKRTGKGLTRMVDYVPQASYRPRLGWKDAAEKTARAQFPTHFWRAMRRAMASARP